MPLDLVILVPVFNEADHVRPLTEELAVALRDRFWSYALVWVDDGSTDGTWAAIEAMHRNDPRVCGLRHARNCGQSAALWTGVRETASRWIATLDGDRQNDPADLPAMVEMMSEVDFVSGHRTARQDSWLRRISSRIAWRARKWILRSEFEDTGCALRVFKRETLNTVFPFNGWHRFLPILVQAAGWRTREIPVRHRPRQAGVSKYGVGNRLGRGLWDLAGVSWYLRRRLKPAPIDRTLPSERPSS